MRTVLFLLDFQRASTVRDMHMRLPCPEQMMMMKE